MNKLHKTAIAFTIGAAAIGSVAFGAAAANAADSNAPARQAPSISSVTGATGDSVPASKTPEGAAAEKPNVVYEGDGMSISGAPGVTADDVVAATTTAK